MSKIFPADPAARRQRIMTIAVIAAALVAVAIFVRLGVAIYRYETENNNPPKNYPAPTPSASINAAASANTDTNKIPNPEAPTYPEEARQNNTYGVEVFIKYFYKAYDYALHTNDLEPLQELYDRQVCEPCDVYRKRVENDNADHLIVYEADHIIRNIEMATATDILYLGEFTFDRKAGKLLAKDGTVVEEAPELLNKKIEFSIKWVDDKFTMTHLESD